MNAKIHAAAITLATLLLAGACSMMGRNVPVPPESEFGFGPRVSANGIYQAEIEAAAPLRVRRMQEVKLRVQAVGRGPVASATIDVDGGMPQHGHGLPTTPRVTHVAGDGSYEVEGLKFNMGGW